MTKEPTFSTSPPPWSPHECRIPTKQKPDSRCQGLLLILGLYTSLDHSPTSVLSLQQRFSQPHENRGPKSSSDFHQAISVYVLSRSNKKPNSALHVHYVHGFFVRQVILNTRTMIAKNGLLLYHAVTVSRTSFVTQPSPTKPTCVSTITCV